MKEGALGAFGEEYRSAIRHYRCRIEKYALKMDEDYEFFFRRYGGDMYKAHANLRRLREMRPMTYQEDPGKIKEELESRIKSIEQSLIEGVRRPASTGVIHNVADTLDREAQQELREILLALLYAINACGRTG